MHEKRHVIGLYSPAMGSGKTTLAMALHAKGVVSVPFARPMKDMLRALLQQSGGDQALAFRMTDGDLKETPSPLLMNRTPRQAMQWLGTEWGRDLMHPDLWVEAWKARARAEMAAGHHVVADDIRFPNEAQAVRDLAGLTVEVTRPAQGITQAHASEGSLAAWGFDLRLINSACHPLAWGLDGRHAIMRAIA